MSEQNKWLTVGQIALIYDLEGAEVVAILGAARTRKRVDVDDAGRTFPVYNMDDVEAAIVTDGESKLGGKR